VRVHQPLVRLAPGQHWEIDYCTIAPKTEDVPDKQQNGLEVLNIVDQGTSAVIDSQAAADYDAETTLTTVARMLAVNGVPLSLTFDRDPRLVGTNTADPFPSPFLRFLWCVGCEPEVLPPRRPDLKPFVERYQRTLKEDCISYHRPATAQAANEALATYSHWYNYERPHQGRGNNLQAPAKRLPSPSARLPLPETVDPDAWLTHYEERYFRRQVDSRGCIQLWKYDYYVGLAYAGQRCALHLDTRARSKQVEFHGKPLKSLPFLYGRMLPYDEFLG
jgi:hypothetical protein